MMCTGFHAGNFQSGIHGGAYVGNLASILTAVATSGIVFSYNGFQSPVNLAGEARNPGRSIPLAIFGSLALSTVVYLLLQIAFLGAVAPEHLHEGWSALEYSSPFAQLALALNLNWLALLLYADAFVSPSGTGTTYTATTARMIYAMERSGSLPRIFGRVHRPLRHSAARDVVQSAGVVPVPVLLPRLGQARGGHFGRHHHHLSGGAGERRGPAAHGARYAPPAAHARAVDPRARRVRARDAHAVLGALAAHRRDHAAADPADADLPLLPGARDGWRDFGGISRAPGG